MREELNPVTREEMFLAKAAGQDTPDLKPITRVERFLQNLIDHVKSIGTGGGGTGGGGAQPDWNAEEGEPGHVLNRPFYSEYQQATIYSGTDLVPDAEMGMIIVNEVFSLVLGMEYTVNYNGADYVCKCVTTNEEDSISTLILGNMVVNEGEDTGEPFCIISYLDQPYSIIVPLDGSESATVSITGNVETVHELDKKYIKNAVQYYLNEKNVPLRIYSNIDIQLGHNAQECEEGLNAVLANNREPVNFYLTILGKQYDFVLTGYSVDTYWMASINFSPSPGSIQSAGEVYNLRIMVNAFGKIYYYLRKMQEASE